MTNTRKTNRGAIIMIIIVLMLTKQTAFAGIQQNDIGINSIHIGFTKMLEKQKEQKQKAIEKQKKIEQQKQKKLKQKKLEEQKTKTEKKDVASNKSYQGNFKITEYCSACNTPTNSTQTASGRYVPNYTVASSDFPLGTILYIEGIGERRVDDTGCRSGIIDLLISTSDGKCHCDLCTHRQVWIIK